jgi:hypothetical protein
VGFEPYDNEDETFTEADWLEMLAQTGPSDTFSNEAGEAVISVFINKATQGRLRSAVWWVLGYSWADDGTTETPYALHRFPPLGHPVWGHQLRANSVQFTRFNPLANPDNTDNKPYKVPDIGGSGLSKFGNYGQCWMTVRFGPRPLDLYEDDDPGWSGDEWDRYVEVTRDSTLEVLMSDAGGVLFWAETGSGGPPVGNNSFPGQIGELIQKNTINLLWREVPMSYTHDENKIPTKIDAVIGHVNDAEFLGFPAGTLLCQPPKYTKKMFPFFTDDGTGRAFHHDILFQFSHFDPTPGAETPLARGHQLMPWRGGGSGSGAAGSGPGWYTCYRENSTSGKKYLKEADFTTLFDHVDKP